MSVWRNVLTQNLSTHRITYYSCSNNAIGQAESPNQLRCIRTLCWVAGCLGAVCIGPYDPLLAAQADVGQDQVQKEADDWH